MPDASHESAPRGAWAALFHQSTDAVFLLNPRRRLRYVNRAFEVLARTQAEHVIHEFCHPRKIQKDLPPGRRLLLQTLAPPPEAIGGRSVRVRRPVPPSRVGPPWWDITFVPIRDGEKLLGILGTIVPIGPPGTTAGGKGLTEALIALRQRVVDRFTLSRFDGESASARHLRAKAELAARTFSPVWLSGAPGTGKETLARCIHYHGITRELGFAAIDCVGLQPYLIRSLLFGHNGLAETGRVGTIYLKSPEALAPDLQAELIEWVELLADECRVVVGTSSGDELSAAFRAAFGVIEIPLAPLTERKLELPRLIGEVLEEETAAGVPTTGVAPEVEAVLAEWNWPGNLSELRQVMRTATRRANGGRVEIGHLPLAVQRSATDARVAASSARPQSIPKLDDVLEQVERRMIELALRRTRGDQTAAADLLGVYRSRLVRRVKALGLGDRENGSNGSDRADGVPDS